MSANCNEEVLKMVKILSYIIAVILTVALSIVMYPLAAIFWLVGLLGRFSEDLFDFTTDKIEDLWFELT